MADTETPPVEAPPAPADPPAEDKPAEEKPAEEKPPEKKPPPAEKESKGPLDYIAGLFKDDSDPGDVKVNIKQCEMPDDMKDHAVATAKPLVAEKKPHKDIASALKKEFDGKYEPTFICIVGTDFGSSITHTKDCFIYMYMNKTAIMLFKV
ncbi:dynein light chain LC6, flagellar outer arm-like isoform X1 [Branchiostoma lanceolatum]|uniref:dynein light chain LC6, flagellar outer arm-like isoform X1 n=1 Tax=Branchiostoma lanceolatum TaxID=7740 RepID=UPI00345204D8